MNELLRVKDLSLAKENSELIISDINFTISEGEIMGLIGESGSGKTLISRSIVNLLPQNIRVKSGEIYYKGNEILKMNNLELRKIRGLGIATIIQESLSSLNPLLKAGKQIEEVLVSHELFNKQEARRETIKLLSLVGFEKPDEIYNKYPHELSGGMRQRIIIAIGISCKPKLLIADEPTSSLDISSEQEIITLLKNIVIQGRMAMLFITHNLKILDGFAQKNIKIEKRL